jgi:predicted MFS family arabinose efflux permease
LTPFDGARYLLSVKAKRPTRTSWSALRDGGHALATSVVALSVLGPALSAFVTSTVFPSAVADIGGLSIYAWGSTAYAVTSIMGSASLSVLVGRVGGRVSGLVASAIFASGTIICASAWSMSAMVAGRAVQGLGSGFLIGGAYGAVRARFPEHLWPRLLAVISAAWGAAAMTGPALGGFFAARGVWRAAFWTMVPMVLLAAALSWRMLRDSPPRAAARQRALPRLLALCGAVVCVGSVANVRALALQGMLAVAAGAMVILAVRADRRASSPIFPREMLSLAQPLGRGFWTIFLLAMSTSPVGVFIPLLLQTIHGVPPAVAGYLQASQSFSWTMATLVGARLDADRVRASIVLGPCLVTAGFVGLFATIGPGPLPVIAVCIVLIGVGIGTCWAHVSRIILASGRPEEAALTASVVPTGQQFAIAFGAAVSGIVVNATGLSTDPSPTVAALTGAALYGGFALAPLAAAAISVRLRSAVGAPTAAAIAPR